MCRYEEAIDALDEGIKEDSNFIYLLILKAYMLESCLIEEQYLKKAVECYDELIKKNEKFAYLYLIKKG